jgi:hypothetical protein
LLKAVFFLNFSRTAKGCRPKFTSTLEYTELGFFLEKPPKHCYSYLSASTGFSFEARQAGYKAKITPTPTLKIWFWMPPDWKTLWVLGLSFWLNKKGKWRAVLWLGSRTLGRMLLLHVD